MSHTLRIESTFPSALGGQAMVVEALPDQASQEPPVYFHGGHGVNPEKYLRYMAKAHNLHAFSIVYPEKRPRDATYWAIEQGSKQPLTRAEARYIAGTFAGAIVSQGQVAMAEDLLHVIERHGVRVQAIGQSVGALCVTKAVADSPDSFLRVALPYPAGILKPDMRQVLRNGMRYARAWQTRAPLTAEGSIDNSVGLYDPVVPTQLPRNVAANGDNVILSYHAPLLPDTQARPAEYSPLITVFAGQDDHLFTPGRLRQHITDSSIDQFVVVEGRHGVGDRRQIMDQVVHALR